MRFSNGLSILVTIVTIGFAEITSCFAPPYIWPNLVINGSCLKALGHLYFPLFKQVGKPFISSDVKKQRVENRAPKGDLTDFGNAAIEKQISGESLPDVIQIIGECSLSICYEYNMNKSFITFVSVCNALVLISLFGNFRNYLGVSRSLAENNNTSRFFTGVPNYFQKLYSSPQETLVCPSQLFKMAAEEEMTRAN